MNDIQQWGKINACCKYSGVSERTFRGWLKEGLIHSRLPSNRILVKFRDIDEYLKRFEITESEINEQVNAFFKKF